MRCRTTKFLFKCWGRERLTKYPPWKSFLEMLSLWISLWSSPSMGFFWKGKYSSINASLLGNQCLWSKRIKHKVSLVKTKNLIKVLSFMRVPPSFRWILKKRWRYGKHTEKPLECLFSWQKQISSQRKVSSSEKFCTPANFKTNFKRNHTNFYFSSSASQS